MQRAETKGNREHKSQLRQTKATKPNGITQMTNINKARQTDIYIYGGDVFLVKWGLAIWIHQMSNSKWQCRWLICGCHQMVPFASKTCTHQHPDKTPKHTYNNKTIETMECTAVWVVLVNPTTSKIPTEYTNVMNLGECTNNTATKWHPQDETLQTQSKVVSLSPFGLHFVWGNVCCWC